MGKKFLKYLRHLRRAVSKRLDSYIYNAVSSVTLFTSISYFIAELDKGVSNIGNNNAENDKYTIPKAAIYTISGAIALFYASVIYIWLSRQYVNVHTVGFTGDTLERKVRGARKLIARIKDAINLHLTLASQLNLSQEIESQRNIINQLARLKKDALALDVASQDLKIPEPIGCPNFSTILAALGFAFTTTSCVGYVAELKVLGVPVAVSEGHDTRDIALLGGLAVIPFVLFFIYYLRDRLRFQWSIRFISQFGQAAEALTHIKAHCRQSAELCGQLCESILSSLSNQDLTTRYRPLLQSIVEKKNREVISSKVQEEDYKGLRHTMRKHINLFYQRAAMQAPIDFPDPQIVGKLRDRVMERPLTSQADAVAERKESVHGLAQGVDNYNRSVFVRFARFFDMVMQFFIFGMVGYYWGSFSGYISIAVAAGVIAAFLGSCIGCLNHYNFYNRVSRDNLLKQYTELNLWIAIIYDINAGIDKKTLGKKMEALKENAYQVDQVVDVLMNLKSKNHHAFWQPFTEDDGIEVYQNGRGEEEIALLLT